MIALELIEHLRCMGENNAVAQRVKVCSECDQRNISIFRCLVPLSFYISPYAFGQTVVEQLYVRFEELFFSLSLIDQGILGKT